MTKAHWVPRMGEKATSIVLPSTENSEAPVSSLVTRSITLWFPPQSWDMVVPDRTSDWSGCPATSPSWFTI